MNLIEQSLDWLKSLGRTQRYRLIAGLLGIAALTTVLLIVILSPHYGVLFSHLDPQDANPILTELEHANIAYQVRNQGQDIFIDQSLIDKTRLKLMGRDQPFTHSVGFELFDKTDFGMTDFSQKINYQRALQGELERTISSLSQVKHARVQLSIPENHLFQNAHNLPRVAVTLFLNRPLTPRQVNSIQRLITASIAHLPARNVVIVDQLGNGLTHEDDDLSTSHFSSKKKIERYLNEKVMELLQPIFNDETIRVKIDATLNYDELQRERVQPQAQGAITHEKETRHSTPNKSGKTALNQDVTREKSVQFGREKERFTRANGTIERLTISVVLPQKTPNAMRIQVERLVKSVVGFSLKRGDTISVEALIDEPKTLIPNQPPQSPPSFQDKRLIACLLAFVLLGVGTHYRLRQKQRRHLLIALEHWLSAHE